MHAAFVEAAGLKRKNAMLVGFDIRPLIFTGAGIRTYLYNLIVSLAKIEGLRQQLFVSSPSRIAWEDVSATISEDVVRLPHLNRLCGRFWEEFLLSSAVRKKKVDIFHGARFFLPRRLACPSVVTVHDLAFKKFPEFVTRQAFRDFDAMVAYSVQAARAVIVPSEATARDLFDLYKVGKNKVAVIHEAAGPAFRPSPDADRPRRLREKFRTGNKFILCVGTIEPRKNLVNLLEAYAMLKDNDEFTLVLAGGLGWRYGRILEKVKELALGTRVVFTGRVSDGELVDLYNGCEVFVFPSYYEGFGLPVLEALGCACAVVCADTSSLTELFGDACIFVDPHSAASIERGLRKALFDAAVRDRLRARALEKAAGFSWAKAAGDTYAVYGQVLRG
ncbi:MAG: glycosyltransferase family 1 protein [Candidatus Omnitrophica bacterium]|nr:glycosyltransferase family 1 protein [Candidatus Omnitrophota bacterium]